MSGEFDKGVMVSLHHLTNTIFSSYLLFEAGISI
jgi:hypothetical protein